MVDQRFDTLGFLRSSDIERDNRRQRAIGSRWVRCFSPSKENETNLDESTDRASSMASGMEKRQIKRAAPSRDYEPSTSDDEPYLTAAGSSDRFQTVDKSDDQDTGVGSNSRAGFLPRHDVQNCDGTSDTSEVESEHTMVHGVSDYEGNKDEVAKKWSVIVEGGRFGRSRPSVNTMHRVNADLDRYEKGAGIINYKITVNKIMKTENYRKFSSGLRQTRRSLQATSTPKSTPGKVPWRSSSWKPPSGKRASYRETLIRESSLSPRRNVGQRSFTNSVRFSGKVENPNFSTYRGRSPSLRRSNSRKEPPQRSPRQGRRRFSSPPLRRSRSSGTNQTPLRTARSDSSFRRVTFADDSMGSYSASLTRSQDNMDANISGRYTTESLPRRSVPRFSNGRGRSRSSSRSYGERQYEEDAESGKPWNFKNFDDHREFMAQDINPSESFTEQMRRVQLEGQEAENPFSVWDPDSSRWSRDFDKSFDEFMGPGPSSSEKDEDASSGSLFSDEMEINPRRRLTPRQKKLLFHTWNPVFYCNQNPGYIRNINTVKTTMTDPRYRVFN